MTNLNHRSLTTGAEHGDEWSATGAPFSTRDQFNPGEEWEYSYTKKFALQKSNNHLIKFITISMIFGVLDGFYLSIFGEVLYSFSKGTFHTVA